MTFIFARQPATQTVIPAQAGILCRSRCPRSYGGMFQLKL